MAVSDHRPRHDEVEQFAQSEATQEPESGEFNILVSIPESIEIKMVDATVLSDYEIWFFSAGAVLSFVTGFLVAYIQEPDLKVAKALSVAGIIFGVMFIGCLIMALTKRHTLRKKGKVVRLKTSKVAQEKK
jgi:hypothetical protein